MWLILALRRDLQEQLRVVVRVLGRHQSNLVSLHVIDLVEIIQEWKSENPLFALNWEDFKCRELLASFPLLTFIYDHSWAASCLVLFEVLMRPHCIWP